MEQDQPVRKYNRIRREVQRNKKQLQAFQQLLGGYLRGRFTDPASLRTQVMAALADWRTRHPEPAPSTAPGDPGKYLQAIEEDCGRVHIRGLTSRRAEPYVFGIDEIYIPLTTLAGRGEMAEQRRIDLDEVLSERKAVIVGEPGSGKSTYLRRTAYQLARTANGRFPILIRIGDLSRVLAAERIAKANDSPDWIPYFLGRQSAEFNWGLSEDFFRRRLNQSDCLLMVDGLDEAPDRWLRQRIARLFEKATASYAKCHFLVSTRPKTYFGDSVLAGFKTVQVNDLEREQMTGFFDHFARALALGDAAEKQFKERSPARWIPGWKFGRWRGIH